MTQWKYVILAGQFIIRESNLGQHSVELHYI